MNKMLDWMIAEIRKQVYTIKLEISGLPEKEREKVIDEIIDILKGVNEK